MLIITLFFYICVFVDKGSLEFILYNTFSGIYHYDLNAQTINTVYEGASYFSLEYINDTNCVIFSQTQSIEQYCLSGNNNTLETIIPNYGYITGIAYDWLGKNIFLASYHTGQILTAEMNNSNLRVLFNRTHLEGPVSLALDPYKGWMYWTDQSYTNPRIARAQMNGNQSTYQVLLQGGYLFKYPFGLTIDHQFENMYWTDNGLNHVMKASLLGENIETIASGVNVIRPFGISICESTVFWADNGKMAIMYSDVRPGHRGAQLLVGNISSIVNVEVVGCQMLRCCGPEVSINQTLYSKLTNSETTLACSFAGIPAVTSVFWQKYIDNTYSIITIDGSKYAGANLSYPNLIIRESQPNDSGLYQCGATNPLGTSYSLNVTLNITGSAPVVIVSQNKYNRFTNSETVLACFVSGSPEVTAVFWQMIKNSMFTNLTIDEIKLAGSNLSFPSLIIKNSQSSDNGTYRCVATNQVGISYSANVSLTVTGSVPLVIVSNDSYSKLTNSETILTCSVSGNPAVNNVFWQKGINNIFAELTVDGSRLKWGNLSNPSLVITRSQPSDSGLYRCGATNPVGTTYSSNVLLTVTGSAPVVLVKNVSYSQLTGFETVLTSSVSGNPEVTSVFWQKNINNTYFNLTIDGSKFAGSNTSYPSLIIKSSQPLDSGQYRCGATNQVDTSYSNVISLAVTGSVPIVTVSTLSYLKITNSESILECSVLGSPEVINVFWQTFINDSFTTLSIDGSKLTGSNISFPSLAINNSQPSDSGEYRCGATNLVGTSYSSSINLTVTGSPPVVTVTTDAFVQFTNSKTILECIVFGTPDITNVFWQKYIKNSFTTLSIHGSNLAGSNTSFPSLIIRSSQPSDSGEYRCGATNLVDTSYSSSVNLTVTGDIPIVTVSEVSYSKITNSETILACSVYGKPEVIKVFWQRYKDKNYTILTIDGSKLAGVSLNQPSLIIKNSQPNDTGIYRCVATSPVGTTYSSNVYLTVTGRSPVIEVGQQYSRVANTDIIMECVVSGNPEISSVFWQKLVNAKYVGVNIDGTKISGSNISFPGLIIRSLQPLDSGEYRCGATNQVGTSYSSIVSLKVTATPMCPEENETIDNLNYTWPKTRAGEVFKLTCPNPEYSITRHCLSIGQDTLWGNTENNCNIEKDLEELSSLNLNETSPEDVLNTLEKVTTKAKQYTTKNVNTSISVLEKVLSVQSPSNAVNISENVVAIISNVLESEENALHDSGSDTRILSIIDKVAETVNISTKPFKVVKPNIAVYAVPASKDKFKGYTLVTNTNPSGSLNAENVEIKTEDVNEISKSSFIKLPESLSSSLSEQDLVKLDRVTFAVHSSGKLFKNSNTNLKKEQKGLILSASLPGMKVENLTQPVVVSLQKPQQGDAECVFWDNTIPGKDSWSSRGCKTIDYKRDGFIKCECSHLTNFAMLMDIYVEKIVDVNVQNQIISAVSYTGCSVSIIGLVLTLTTMFYFRITGSNQYKILINFCFALLGNNLVFVIGQQEYSAVSEKGCKVVAVLQHYFLLACFLWTLVEAYSMYLALVKVFAKYTSRFILKAAGVGWGLPAVIVFITLIVNLSDNYGKQRGNICWLDTYAFYGAFVSVLALVLVLNVISFILVTKRLLHRSGIASSKERDSTKTRLRRVVSVMVLLGITWILGFLPIGGTGGVVVQYLFAILNSLQGLFIFVFNCVLNKEVSKKWKKLIPKCKLGTGRSYSISGEELSKVTNEATVSSFASESQMTEEK